MSSEIIQNVKLYFNCFFVIEVTVSNLNRIMVGFVILANDIILYCEDIRNMLILLIWTVVENFKILGFRIGPFIINKAVNLYHYHHNPFY